MEVKNVISIHFKMKEYQRGDILYEDNDNGSSIFLIKKGEVEVSSF